MEFVRKIVDASSLMNIIQLPDTLRNRKLEIIVLPVEEAQEELSSKNIAEFDISDITQSLIGSIPLSDISLEQIKEERLARYESIV